MENKTCFQKIAHFNELIGNEKSGFANLKQQFEMIREEFIELEAALERFVVGCGLVDSGDYTPEEVFGIGGCATGLIEVRDGMADVVVTVGGLAHRLGVDIDADLEEVYQSNMSKFLLDEEAGGYHTYQSIHNEAGLRAALLGISVDIKETAPGVWALTSSEDQTGKDGKFYPKGKLLKPSTYREPNFK